MKLDLKWIFRGPGAVAQRLKFTGYKYSSIWNDRRQISFLGKLFFFDNRLIPALLSDYVFELDELDGNVDFRNLNSIFDIGANVGQFAFTLKAINPDIKMYSFEPNPEAFVLLKKNSHAYVDWTCLPFGIGISDEKSDFYFVHGKSAQGSLFRDNAVLGLLAKDCERISVDLKSLDKITRDEFRLPGRVDIIKIDVEGAEAQVLQGISTVAWKYLYIELSESRSGGLNLEGALKILSENTGAKITLKMKTLAEGAGGAYQALFFNPDFI